MPPFTDPAGLSVAAPVAATLAPQKPVMNGFQLLGTAAIIMAGLYIGRELLVPMVLAVLLAFVLTPAVQVLRRARLPHAAAVMVAVVLAFSVIGGIGAIVGSQGADLARGLPAYRSIVQDKVRALSEGSEIVGRLVTSIQQGVTGTTTETVAAAPTAVAEAPSTLLLVRTVLEPLLSPLATAGVVLLFLIFVLLYREDLRDRLVRLGGRRDLHRTILAMNDAAGRLSQYFLVQLALNAGFGVYVTAALWFTGLPNPVLWGILAAVMRFVPFIGTVLAVVPPMLLALAVAPGWLLALGVAAILLGGDIVMAQVVEPLTYGHSTGLSPIAVILSTAFWAFLWGPAGLLLATPLTVCLVVLGRHVEGLAFLHVMLGDQAPLEPAETFYQRALEGNRAALLLQAQREIERTGPVEYADHVALAGLALAQADLARDALEFERLEAIHDEIQRLLVPVAALAGPRMARSKGAPKAVPAAWAAAGSVLCIPGRGELDDLAATLAMQSLQAQGFGAALVPNAALGGRDAVTPHASDARLCLISALEEGSSADSIRFFTRRIRQRVPNAAVVIGLWHATAGSTVLGDLRAEGGEEFIVLSIGELLALANALAARGAPPPALDQRSGQNQPISGTPTAITSTDSGAPSLQ